MAVGVPIHINHTLDITVGFSLHDYTPPAAPTTKVPALPTLEFPVPHFWPPGVGSGAVKKTTTVFVGGSAIIQEGHDLGPLVPQLTFVQPNLWNLVFPLTSKRKIMFQSFYNRMDKKQVGLTNLIPIPLPMLACGEPISIPLSFPILNFLNSVRVGLTIADFVGGWLNILITMGTEYLIKKIWPGKKDADGKDIRTAKDKIQENLGSALLGTLAGGISTSVQHLIDSNYPVKVDLSVKITDKTKVGASVQFGSADTTNNPSSVTGSVTYTNKQKNQEGKETGKETSVTGSAAWTWDAGDKKNKEGGTLTVGANQKSPTGNSKAEGTASYNPHNVDAQGRNNDVSVGGTATHSSGSGGTQSGSVTHNPHAPAGEKTTTSTTTTSGNSSTTSTTAPNATGKGTTTTTTHTSGSSSTTTTASNQSSPFGHPL